MDRTVLVTGCSSGIGRATVTTFLDEGWTVYATARDPAGVERLGERDGCTIAPLDVTDDGDVERVVGRMRDDVGRVDCLVNNAGFGQLGPLEDVPVDALHRQFDVSVYGPHRLVRAVLPGMRERGDGTIVTVSSVVGRLSIPGSGAYCASRAAVESLSDALRAEVDGHGVDVVLVEPGPVETDPRGRVAEEPDENLDRSGAYESLYRALEDARAVADGPWSVAPERVAATVVDAAAATRPRARYPVGTLARLATLGRLVPDAARDRAFALLDRLR